MAAKTLGIPMEMIEVQPTSSVFNVNSSASNMSVTSDLNTFVSVALSLSITDYLSP